MPDEVIGQGLPFPALSPTCLQRTQQIRICCADLPGMGCFRIPNNWIFTQLFYLDAGNSLGA